MKFYSLVNTPRLEVIKELVNYTNSLPGACAEIGVYKGGTAGLIIENTERSIYLCDTFAGLPYWDEIDGKAHKVGSFSEIPEDERNLFLEYVSKKSNVKVYKGIFPSETGDNLSNEVFSFVHLDVDAYESYKQCLNFFYNRMVPNGVIVFDDYNASSCPGAKLAVDEFFSDKPEKVVTTVECQAMIVKM